MANFNDMQMIFIDKKCRKPLHPLVGQICTSSMEL